MNNKIDEIIKKWDKCNKKHSGRIECYKMLINACQFSWNPKNNFDQKQSKLINATNLLVLLLFLITAVMLLISNDIAIICLFVVQITTSIAIIILNKLCRKNKLLITKEDKLYELFDKIYSKSIIKWTELESFITAKHSIEMVGNTLHSKYIPYIATSLSLTIIFRLIKHIGEYKTILGYSFQIDVIISILIALTGIFFMVKSFKYREIDKLEFLLKNMASFVDEKQNKST